VTAIGFSTSTWRPCSSAARTIPSCVVAGVAITTASTSSRANNSSMPRQMSTSR
jgi:hypothetical protein